MIFLKLVVLLVAAAAAFSDLHTERIPNRLTLPCLGAGIGLQCMLSPEGPGMGLLGSLLGIAFPFGLLFLPYCLRMIGAGDVKLLMALGALAGWPGSMGIFLGTLIFGSGIALGLMVRRAGMLPRIRYFGNYFRLLMAGAITPYRREGKQPENMHFAVPVLFGTVAWLAFC